MGCHGKSIMQRRYSGNWVLNVQRGADGIARRYKRRVVVFGKSGDEQLTNTVSPGVELSIVRWLFSFGRAEELESTPGLF